jgi:UDP-N-acetylglucosamine acyltransferase
MNQPLAYVHPGAKIAKNVVVEPFSTINNNVEIGEGTWVGSNVTIMEGARLVRIALSILVQLFLQIHKT